MNEVELITYQLVLIIWNDEECTALFIIIVIIIFITVLLSCAVIGLLTDAAH